MNYFIHIFLIALAGFSMACSNTERGETRSDFPEQISITEQHAQVSINGQAVNQAALKLLETQYGIKVKAGQYWYDKVSGLWGYWGQHNQGVIPAGLDLAGPLPYQASGGSTKVIVNGRAIHPLELQSLRALGPVAPGRYWLDNRGNYGYEGGPMLGNLLQFSGGSNQGSSFFRNEYTGIGGGSSGGTSYIIGDGFSVIVD